MPTIPDPSINLLPVVAAGILNMIIGMLWYSPYVFGKLWVKSMNKTEDEMKQGANPLVYVFSTIGSLLFAYIFAHIVKFAGLHTAAQGAATGFWVWLGFVIPTVLMVYLYEGRPKIPYFIYIFCTKLPNQRKKELR